MLVLGPLKQLSSVAGFYLPDLFQLLPAHHLRKILRQHFP